VKANLAMVKHGQLSRQLNLENLENRQLMAADISLAAGELRVTGTDAAEVITFDNVLAQSRLGTQGSSEPSLRLTSGIHATIKTPAGQIVLQKSFAADQVSKLVADAKGGNDAIANNTSKAATMIGGYGSDSLQGGSGRDELYGGTTASVDYGGSLNTLRGGGGNDYLSAANGVANTLFGDAGNDYLRGGNSTDIMYGGSGDDSIYGNSGSDTIYGGSGSDHLDGGHDKDVLHGEDGDDWLTGGGGDDVLYGDAGNDLLAGELGNDKLYGGTGNDDLSGDGGDDQLVGGDGADTLDGGAGFDSLYSDYGSDGNTAISFGSDDTMYFDLLDSVNDIWGGLLAITAPTQVVGPHSGMKVAKG
jgi:Ca2+-binding RTX toxin-like protein